MQALPMGHEDPLGLLRRKRPNVPDHQRKRVRIACQHCRKHKLRCNGATPCERCKATSRPCAYTTVLGSPVSGHPRALTGNKPTQANSWRIPDQQGERDASAFIPSPHWPSPTSNEPERSQSRSRSRSRSPYPASSSPSRNSSTLPEVIVVRIEGQRAGPTAEQNHDEEMVLNTASPSAASLTVFDQRLMCYDGDSSYLSFMKSVRQAVADEADEADLHADDAGGNDPSSVNQTWSICGLDTGWRTATLSALPPRDVIDFLTMGFFRFAQGNYFCIHPDVFSRNLTAFWDGTQEFSFLDTTSSQRSIEFISTLFMVLAIGSQLAHLSDPDHEVDSDSGDIDELPGNLADLARLQVPRPHPNPGLRFYEISRRLLPDVICSSSMTSVQVCLLQGLYLPSLGRQDAGYNMLGLALRMSINMGIHKLIRSSSIRAHIREQRNRLWWSVYIAERLYSIDMGRPLSIDDSEIDAPYPSHLPELGEENDPASCVDGTTAMAKLCKVLGKIMKAVYCKRNQPKGATIRPYVLRDLRVELQHWKLSVPASAMFDGTKPTRSSAHLFMTYEQANLLLTRPCLNMAAFLQKTKKLISDEAETLLKQETQRCADAAIEAIKILSCLRSNKLLSRYSFHDTLYCSSALYVLLLVNQRLKNSIVAPWIALKQGLLVLFNLSRGNEAAASSLRYVLRVLTSSAANGAAGSTASSNEDQDAQSRNEWKGKHAWREWLRAQAAVDQQGPSSYRSVDHTANSVSVTDNLDPAVTSSSVAYGPSSDDLGGHPFMKPSEASAYNELEHCGTMYDLEAWSADGMTASLRQELSLEPAQMPLLWMPDLLGADVLDRGFT